MTNQEAQDTIRQMLADWDNLTDEQRTAASPAEQAEIAAVPSPYNDEAEHARQSSAGTHLFDGGCRFCAEREINAAMPGWRLAIDAERLEQASDA